MGVFSCKAEESEAASSRWGCEEVEASSSSSSSSSLLPPSVFPEGRGAGAGDTSILFCALQQTYLGSRPRTHSSSSNWKNKFLLYVGVALNRLQNNFLHCMAQIYDHGSVPLMNQVLSLFVTHQRSCTHCLGHGVARPVDNHGNPKAVTHHSRTQTLPFRKTRNT